MMDDKNKEWFMTVIEGMVKNPSSANFGVSSSMFDLEVILRVAEEDKSVFTEEVCVSLSKLLTVVTGITKPVVYLYDDPHPQAAEAIHYALHNV